LPEIQSGIQAYNYGLKLIEKYFGHMYINFSISPAFPAQYAQSRRIACDAWNKIKDTEYTLNALSYGWWLDKPYQFNDPDHIVLRDATEGENRARVTSGVITGIFICGDDFSAGGAEVDKERAKKFLTNADVISIANGVSFRPVEGCGERSENQFIRIEDDNTAHYAIFNYTDQQLDATIDMQRIGLDAEAAYTLRELWSGVESEATGSFQVSVPAADVAIFRIVKK
jgi:alpha-galactosidase